MTRLAALLCILAGPAVSQAYNANGLDIFDLTAIDKHTSILTYHNSAEQNSIGSPRDMEGEGFTLELDLQITSGDEVLTVTPSPGWVAIPETISVADGDTDQIKIVEVLGF